MRDIDEVVAELRRRLPNLRCEQLWAKHPGADDDGLWFFEVEADGDGVQVESSNGMCPFLVESSASPSRVTCATIRSTVETVEAALRRA